MLMSDLIERNLKGDLKDLFREFYKLADENFIRIYQLPDMIKFSTPGSCLLRTKFDAQKIKDSGIKELDMFCDKWSIGHVWFIQVLPGHIQLWVKIFSTGSPSKYKISLNGDGFAKSFYYNDRREMELLKIILEEFLNRLQFLKVVLLTDQRKKL